MTIELERNIYSTTSKQGTFGCFEVTIGFNGKERVDYMTYNTKGVWRCYEVKVSKSDFNSKAKKTFLGHYNYYVMTKELYGIVKDQIPSHIGVYIGNCSVKRAKKRRLGISEQVLKDSMIRSLYREADKIIKSDIPSEIEKVNTWKNYYKKELDACRRDYNNLMSYGREKYGSRWYKS